jgi:VWFA-related protein
MRRRPDKNTTFAVRAGTLGLALVLAPALVERPAHAQAPPSGEPRARQDMPTFPSQVELITVDAVVLDAAGRPVPGLTKDDFVVKEDGRVQEIQSFEAFVAEPVEAPTAPPVVATNEEGPLRRANGRAFSIVIDDLRIAPERAEVARSAIGTFLERSVRDGDLVTVRTSSGDVSWTSRIPDGTEDLLAVLDRVKGRDVAEQSIDRMTEYEAFVIANREDSPAMAAEGLSVPSGAGAGGRAPAMPTASDAIPSTGLGSIKERVKQRWSDSLLCIPANCDSLVRGRAMEIDATRRSRLAGTLSTVRRELSALALEHGRKSLLFVSDGFLEDFSSDLRETAAESRKANTAVYFIDLRGLVATPGFGSAADPAGFALPDPRVQEGMKMEDSVLSTAGAQTLADQTGGFSVRGTNDLSGGLETIARESRVFYMLGFYPPQGKSGREWRNLAVEVKRPGLKVRARRGYTLATAEPEPERPAKKGHPPGPDPMIARALDAAADEPGIPLRGMAYVQEPRPGDKVHVLVAAELDASRLALEHKGDAQVGRVDVTVVAVNRDTGIGFRHDDTVDVRVPAGEAPGWRALLREFELPPGISQARVVVRDTATGAMGSVTQRFEVPVPGSLHLSTPIVTDRVEPAVDPKGLPRPALAVHRVFAPGGGLYLQFEVFGASRQKGGPHVTAGLEIWAAGSRLARKVDPTPIAADAGGRLVREMGISLEGMGEGPYDLVLDVQDETTGARLKHRESFVLSSARAGEALERRPEPSTPSPRSHN